MPIHRKHQHIFYESAIIICLYTYFFDCTIYDVGEK